jgi:hypothetical protein
MFAIACAVRRDRRNGSPMRRPSPKFSSRLQDLYRTYAGTRTSYSDQAPGADSPNLNARSRLSSEIIRRTCGVVKRTVDATTDEITSELQEALKS